MKRAIGRDPRMTAAAVACALVMGLGVGTVAGRRQLHPPEPHRHPEGRALANPIEATPQSVAIGRTRYVFSCRQCHGNTGRGDGDMAHAGGVPSDFTDDVWQHGSSDGEIFLVIRDGVSADMQPYGNQMSDDDIWHLVNYVKTLAE